MEVERNLYRELIDKKNRRAKFKASLKLKAQNNTASSKDYNMVKSDGPLTISEDQPSKEMNSASTLILHNAILA